MLKIYGIKNCDGVRKAIKHLKDDNIIVGYNASQYQVKLPKHKG